MLARFGKRHDGGATDHDNVMAQSEQRTQHRAYIRLRCKIGRPLAHRLGRDRGQSDEGLTDMVLPSQHRPFVQRLRESRKQLGQNPSHQIEHRGGRFDCQNVSTRGKQ